jgi:hypothetical protein
MASARIERAELPVHRNNALRVIVVLFSAENISIHSKGGAIKYSREVQRNLAGTRTRLPVAAVP